MNGLYFTFSFLVKEQMCDWATVIDIKLIYMNGVCIIFFWDTVKFKVSVAMLLINPTLLSWINFLKFLKFFRILTFKKLI